MGDQKMCPRSRLDPQQQLNYKFWTLSDTQHFWRAQVARKCRTPCEKLYIRPFIRIRTFPKKGRSRVLKFFLVLKHFLTVFFTSLLENIFFLLIPNLNKKFQWDITIKNTFLFTTCFFTFSQGRNIITLCDKH